MIAASETPIPAPDLVMFEIGTGSSGSPSRWLRKVFRRRFRDIVRFLKKAGRSANKDPEDVHQLRVACRRSVAALNVLEMFLPQKRTRRLKRTLKSIRRAAGELRDVDVFTERVQTDESLKLSATNRRRILRYLRRRRWLARKPLARICRRMRKRSFKRTLRQFVERVPRRGAGTQEEFTTNAGRVLRQSIDEFREVCSRDLVTAADLHALRIAGKKLRYTLEVFRDRGNAGQVRPALLVMKEFQERLGSVNDHVVAAERIRGWLNGVRKPVLRKTLKQLAKRERRLSEQTGREFREWFADCDVRAMIGHWNNTVPTCSPLTECSVHIPVENERQLSQHRSET